MKGPDEEARSKINSAFRNNEVRTADDERLQDLLHILETATTEDARYQARDIVRALVIGGIQAQRAATLQHQDSKKLQNRVLLLTVTTVIIAAASLALQVWSL